MKQTFYFSFLKDFMDPITIIHNSEEEISIWLYKFVSYDNIKVDITIFSNTKFRITRGYLSFSEPR